MPKLVEFAVVPAVSLGQGECIGNLSEADIIQKYVKALSDELDGCAIRHRISTAPFPYEFVIHCGLGFYRKPPSQRPLENTSRVYMGTPEVNGLACLLSDGLGHWGKVYVSHGHRGAKPVVDREDKLLQVQNGGVRLEPFVLNGAKAAEYACRLEQLGRDMGRIVADYVASGDHGAKVKLTTAENMAPRLVRPGF